MGLLLVYIYKNYLIKNQIVFLRFMFRQIYVFYLVIILENRRNRDEENKNRKENFFFFKEA